MKIKTLALSLALVLGVISTVETRASTTQERSFSHPENFHGEEQHASTEKSFVDENRPDSKIFDEVKSKNNPMETTKCGAVEPDRHSNAQATEKEIE